MTWGPQPVCDACWRREHGDRDPVRLRHANVERCCYCAEPTRSGILVRLDSATVPYPRGRAPLDD